MNVFFRVGLAFLVLDQNQHFFELAQVGGRFDSYVEKQVFTVSDFGDNSDWQSLGENLVAPAGQHGFSHGDLLVAHDTFEIDFAVGGAAQHALQASL